MVHAVRSWCGLKHIANTTCLQTPPVKFTLSSCEPGVIVTMSQMRKWRPDEVSRLLLDSFRFLAVIYWRKWGLLFVLVTTSFPFPFYSQWA